MIIAHEYNCRLVAKAVGNFGSFHTNFKMWKFLGKKFGRSSGASIARSTGESVADLRGKYYLEKVCKFVNSEWFTHTLHD